MKDAERKPANGIVSEPRSIGHEKCKYHRWGFCPWINALAELVYRPVTK
jgi:hypothetical protein